MATMLMRHLPFVRSRGGLPVLRSRCFVTNDDSIWNIHPPVAEAMRNGRPVVALESTIVAHGMPYPHNLQLTQQVASLLRSTGVEPATIAIRNGQCCIGLSEDDLDDLAQCGPSVKKCSTREVSLSLARTRDGAEKWGATTVASTMRLAHLAGIPAFVTGGIGGVHRGGEITMDVSADLTELSRTPVIVVCAGIKSILDIGRTLEVLETNGVPVISYQSDEFPAFFTASSGIRSPERMDSASEIADAFLAAQSLGLSHGMLVAVPNVKDSVGYKIESAIQTAVQEADRCGISGRDVTPYILKRVNELTHGESLRSNMSLVLQNAAVGAEIALELARKDSAPSISKQTRIESSVHVAAAAAPLQSDVIVVGAAIIDLMAKPKESLVLETSNPATCHESDGGVGRNIAETLGRLGSKPLFYSAVGDDNAGKSMMDRLEHDYGVVEPHQTISVVPGWNTARYLAILDHHGDLKVACADVGVLDHLNCLPDDQILANAKFLVLDANLPMHLMENLAARASNLGTTVVFEPTCVPKAIEALPLMHHVSLAFPNVAELKAMVGENGSTTEDQIKILLASMHPSSATLVVTAGRNGVYVGSRVGTEEPRLFFQPVEQVVETVNTTGAGDTFAGAFLHSMLRDNPLDDSVRFGMKAAALSVQYSSSAVSPLLSPSNPSL